jgi:MscS family membrane protein
LAWCFWADAAQPAPATNAVPDIPVKLVPADVSTNTAYLTFGLDRIEALQTQRFGIPYYQYLASVIYIFLALFAARLIDWIIGSILKTWAKRTTTRLDDILLELLHGPVKVIAFVIFLHVGLRVFPWPDWIENFISKVLQVVVAISLTYLALKTVDMLIGYWKQRAANVEDKVFDTQLIPIVRNTSKVFVVVVAFLVTSQNLGLHITGLLASLSVGGLAVGLAAQDTLANLFGAVAVFVDKPFRVGDRIKLDAVEGEVESIGMRSTRVRTADGHLVTIPNKTVGNATITNIAKRLTIRTVMNIGITYDTPADKVKRAVELLGEIYRSEPMTKDVLITFNKFVDSALNIEVIHFWNSTDHRAYLNGLQALNLRVKEAFDREAIEFAFPTQTIYVKETAQLAA